MRRRDRRSLLWGRRRRASREPRRHWARRGVQHDAYQIARERRRTPSRSRCEHSPRHARQPGGVQLCIGLGGVAPDVDARHAREACAAQDLLHDARALIHAHARDLCAALDGLAPVLRQVATHWRDCSSVESLRTSPGRPALAGAASASAKSRRRGAGGNANGHLVDAAVHVSLSRWKNNNRGGITLASWRSAVRTPACSTGWLRMRYPHLVVARWLERACAPASRAGYDAVVGEALAEPDGGLGDLPLGGRARVRRWRA